MDVINADEKRMWREYCAVVQLPMQMFLEIQNTLLSEQLDLIGESDWFTDLVPGHMPKSVDEFRRKVPLRTWRDYMPILDPESVNGLAEDLQCWVHTSWCRGSYKKVPWVRRFFLTMCPNSLWASSSVLDIPTTQSTPGSRLLRRPD